LREPVVALAEVPEAPADPTRVADPPPRWFPPLPGARRGVTRPPARARLPDFRLPPWGTTWMVVAIEPSVEDLFVGALPRGRPPLSRGRPQSERTPASRPWRTGFPTLRANSQGSLKLRRYQALRSSNLTNAQRTTVRCRRHESKEDHQLQFFVGFHQLDALEGMEGRCVTGLFPHLRLVSLLPGDVTADAAAGLPAHLRDRIVADPPPELVGTGLHGVLSTNSAETQQILTTVPPDFIFDWGGLALAYDRWLHGVYLPHCATTALYSPEKLYPADWANDAMTLEIVGSCEAYFMEQQVQAVAAQLGVAIASYHTLQNHPISSPPSGTARATARLVVPPLRYMHHDTLDDIVVHADHGRLFEETRAHLVAYLDSVLVGQDDTPHFVTGFVEPCINPMGVSFHTADLSNLKYFVRCLNDVVVEWCDVHTQAWYIDANEIASMIGKNYADDGPIAHYAHRIPFDPYDDWVERDEPVATIPVLRSFDIRSAHFYEAIVREVCTRLVVLSGRGQVKAVIVDLDNTLWRGLASDQVVGSWNGRPQGLVEALKILKKRGVLLAVASKNDEAYIRTHWDRILRDYAEVPLGCALSLEDFDAVRIDFRPKSVTVGEILAELNIGADAAVFIDDNPLEREEVQAAFPTMRILGAELNYVRRELLFSPFTQRARVTAEDANRSATVRQHALLEQHAAAGTADDFLSALGLSCRVSEVDDARSSAAQRAVQLINKTNQWNLNGGRISESELSLALTAGRRLVVAHTQDASNDYGLVAAALLDPASHRITHMVVSCRVIGMGIDDALAHCLLGRFGPTLAFDYADSGRNMAVRSFLAGHGASGDDDHAFELRDGLVDLSRITPPPHVVVIDETGTGTSRSQGTGAGTGAGPGAGAGVSTGVSSGAEAAAHVGDRKAAGTLSRAG
jgi:FkbH-like protein